MGYKFFSRTNIKEAIAGYLFVLPNLIGFSVFTLFGIIFTLYISFTDWNLVKDFSTHNFVGFQNYVELFNDGWFTSSLLNNFWFFAIIPIQVFVALLVATLLNTDLFLRAPVRTMFFLPYVTNLVAVSVVWMTLFHPSQGPINQLLMAFGVDNPPLWLADIKWAKPGIGLILIWQQLGYHSLVFLTSLQSIPGDLYESANIDGANRIQTFFKITIPMVSPTTFMIIIICLISNFQSWAITQVLTDGGPGTSTYTMGFFIYVQSFRNFKMGYASSAAWILFLIALIVILVQYKSQKKWADTNV